MTGSSTASTIFLTLKTLLAEPTDVPPNFITFILLFVSDYSDLCLGILPTLFKAGVQPKRFLSFIMPDAGHRQKLLYTRSGFRIFLPPQGINEYFINKKLFEKWCNT